MATFRSCPLPARWKQHSGTICRGFCARLLVTMRRLPEGKPLKLCRSLRGKMVRKDHLLWHMVRVTEWRRGFALQTLWATTIKMLRWDQCLTCRSACSFCYFLHFTDTDTDTDTFYFNFYLYFYCTLNTVHWFLAPDSLTMGIGMGTRITN